MHPSKTKLGRSLLLRSCKAHHKGAVSVKIVGTKAKPRRKHTTEQGLTSEFRGRAGPHLSGRSAGIARATSHPKGDRRSPALPPSGVCQHHRFPGREPRRSRREIDAVPPQFTAPGAWQPASQTSSNCTCLGPLGAVLMMKSYATRRCTGVTGKSSQVPVSRIDCARSALILLHNPV